MERKKIEFEINGIEKSTQNIEKLGDTVDKIDIKIKGLSVTAKDVADTFKVNIQDLAEYVAIHSIQLSGKVSELTSHTGQAIDKNIEAAAKKINDSGESSLSFLEVTAVKASVLMDSLMNKITDRSEEQSAKLKDLMDQNNKLTATSLDEISEQYKKKGKEINIFNVQALMDNVQAHKDELNKIKIELEAATLHTRIQYDAMSLCYAEDSEEFKKNQADKVQAITDLRIKIEEVDKQIQQTQKSGLSKWQKVNEDIKNGFENTGKFIENKTEEISNKVTKVGGNVENFVDKKIYGIDKLKKDFSEIEKLGSQLDKELKTFDEEEKKQSNEKYDERIKQLEKEKDELGKSFRDEKEKEKSPLENDKKAAEKKKKKYEADIQKIEAAFGANAGKETDTTNTNLKNSNIDLIDSDYSGGNIKNDDTPPTEEKSEEEKKDLQEREAAFQRIQTLRELADAEAKIMAEKEEGINKINKAIVDSDRSVLLEKMRIEDEIVTLNEEKTQKAIEIDEKEKNRKKLLVKAQELYEEVQKKAKIVKEKVQLAKDIAKATADVAKGVAAAWGNGPILGPVMAAFVAINGGLQIKKMTEQLIKFQDGGLLRGKRHTQGGMRIEGSNIEVEGGEYVINRQSTHKNMGLIRYINSQRKQLTPSDINTYFARPAIATQSLPFSQKFALGGELPTINNTVSVDNEALVDAIRSIKITPKVAVTDIIRAQDQMAEVNAWTGM